MNDSPEMLLCLLGLPHHIPACRQNSLYGRAVLLGGNIRRFRGDAVDGQLLQVGVGQHQRALAVKGDGKGVGQAAVFLVLPAAFVQAGRGVDRGLGPAQAAVRLGGQAHPLEAGGFLGGLMPHMFRYIHSTMEP